MRVFLTGGSGLLGSHLADHLVRNGHEVVALHRRNADTLFLEELDCELAEGDVRDDADTLVPLMEGCTHVVHGAALVYAGGSWPKIRAVNVDGTRNVLSAALRAGVGHAVHVSSVAVYGTVSGPTDERSPTDGDIPAGDLYARSKREAEEVARGIERERGLGVTVVRPSAIYGERDRLTAPELGRLLRSPCMPLMGPGDNALPVVYAGNVAVALGTILEAAPRETTYDLGLDLPLSQRQLMHDLAEGMGRSPLLFKTPAWLVQGGADLLGKFGVSAPGAPHLPLSRLARLALGENPYHSERIRAELGWDPPHEHRDALLRTGRWVVDHL
jgi:nucleoside-diphosphate-sugar epimerase